MAKQSSQVRGEIQGEGRRVNQEHDDFMRMIMGDINNPSGRPGDAYRNQAASGFNSILGRGPSRYDPMFMNAARGGLITDENRNRIRGGGVFDEAAKTGLVSEADKANFRSRSARQAPSFFNALRSKFRTAGQTQGQGPSYNSSLSRMGRDESRQGAEFAENTEGSIFDKVREGRQWGASSMSDAETGLANLESTNKRFGIAGGAGNENANRGIDLEALRGILGVGESSSNDQFRLYEMLLGSMGQRGSLSGRNVSQRAAYDPNVSWFDRLMQIWGGLTGSANAASGMASAGIF